MLSTNFGFSGGKFPNGFLQIFKYFFHQHLGGVADRLRLLSLPLQVEIRFGLRLAHRPLRPMLVDCAAQYRRVDQSPQSHGSHDGDDQDGPAYAGSRGAREVRASLAIFSQRVCWFEIGAECRVAISQISTAQTGIAKSAPRQLSRSTQTRIPGSRSQIFRSERALPNLRTEKSAP
jgi:hypothetical protein